MRVAEVNSTGGPTAVPACASPRPRDGTWPAAPSDGLQATNFSLLAFTGRQALSEPQGKAGSLAGSAAVRRLG